MIWRSVLLFYLSLWFLAGIMLGLLGHAHAEPSASRPYRSILTREARAEWGLRAPVPVFAGQVEQESAWNPHACSPYACGLAQFTPATAKDMAPRVGMTTDVFNPAWALRALVLYDHDLHGQLGGAATECDWWAFTLSAYNGGLGNVRRDKALCASAAGKCDPARWFSGVARTSGRSKLAFAENRAYPDRILRIRQFTYAAWGELVPCP